MTPAADYPCRHFLTQTSIPSLPSGNLYATHGPAPTETTPTHTRLSLRAEIVTPENFVSFERVLFPERHQQLSQTFIPINGRGFYTVMAPSNCAEENGFPALTQLKAFFVPGDVPIQINRTTWHENPMPAQDGTRLLVTSHANLTTTRQQNPDPQLANLPRDLERRWYSHGGYELTVT